MSFGVSLFGGCLAISGGCVTLGPCGSQNTDPCADPCCRKFWLRALSTLGKSPAVTWHRSGDYFVIDAGGGYNDLTAASDRAWDCDDVPFGTLSLGADTKWQWILPDLSGTLTSVAAGLECPPMGDDQWTWVNDAGGGSPDASYYPLSARCAAAPSFPATTSTLTVVGIIDNFTSSAATPTHSSPLWDGTVPGAPGFAATWYVSPVAVRTANGQYVDGQTVQITMLESPAGNGTINVQILGSVGEWQQPSGHWYDPIPLNDNTYTTKGPLYITVGL